MYCLMKQKLFVSTGYRLKGTLQTTIYLEGQPEFKLNFEPEPNEPK